MLYTKEGLVIFVALISAWFIAQFSKRLFSKDYTFKDLFLVSGGMPSSHTASVVAVLTCLFLIRGIDMFFVVSLLFGLIIIRDSFGVRYATGINAKVLKNNVKPSDKKKVLISCGHTKKQVIAGALVGFVIGLVVYMIGYL